MGGSGRDRLDGGAGNDQLSARDGARDIVACGAGRDSGLLDRLDRPTGCEAGTARGPVRTGRRRR